MEALVEREDDIRVDRAEDLEAYLRRKYNKFAIRIMYASSLALHKAGVQLIYVKAYSSSV